MNPLKLLKADGILLILAGCLEIAMLSKIETKGELELVFASIAVIAGLSCIAMGAISLSVAVWDFADSKKKRGIIGILGMVMWATALALGKLYISEYPLIAIPFIIGIIAGAILITAPLSWSPIRRFV